MKKRSGDSSRLGGVGEMLMQKPPVGTPLDWENPLNDGCVVHLAMNEGHGNKVRDLSMNGNHGTLNNFASPPNVISGWNPGQAGVCLKFNANNEHIIIPQSALQSTEFTLSFHEFTTAASGYFLCDSTDPANLFLRREELSIDEVVGRVGDVNLALVSLSSYTWHNHIITHDAAGDIRWYADGIVIGSAAGSNFVGLTSDLWIGNRPALDRDFEGSVDQPRINTRAWSAKEVMDYAINPWQVYEQ